MEETKIEFTELFEFEIENHRIAFDKTNVKWIFYGSDEDGEYEQSFESADEVGIDNYKFDQLKFFVQKEILCQQDVK